MESNDYEKERELLRQLANKEIRAFRQFYKEYSEDLLIFAYTLLDNNVMAISVVEELFERLWVESRWDRIEPPIHAYLFGELQKTCMSRIN